MTNKLKVLRRNPNGVVTIIIVIEALSFANWSSVPMGAHKGRVQNCDAPPNSLIDSITNPKVKTTKVK
jgi:hypothetical protein